MKKHFTLLTLLIAQIAVFGQTLYKLDSLEVTENGVYTGTCYYEHNGYGQVTYSYCTNEEDVVDFEEFVSYDDEGNQIEYSYYGDDYAGRSTFTFSNGLETSRTTYDWIDSTETWEPYSTRTSEYNSSGLLIKEIEVYVDEDNGTDLTDYVYDDDDNLVTEIGTYIFGTDTSFSYRHNYYYEDSILIARTEEGNYFAQNLADSTFYTYDDNNNILVEQTVLLFTNSGDTTSKYITRNTFENDNLVYQEDFEWNDSIWVSDGGFSVEPALDLTKENFVTWDFLDFDYWQSVNAWESASFFYRDDVEEYTGYYSEIIITSTNDPFNTSHLDAYPNPAQDIVHLNTEQFIGNKLAISNIAGEVVHETIISDNTTTIDLLGLESGMYLYSLETGQNIIQGKFTKE